MSINKITSVLEVPNKQIEKLKNEQSFSNQDKKRSYQEVEEENNQLKRELERLNKQHEFSLEAEVKRAKIEVETSTEIAKTVSHNFDSLLPVTIKVPNKNSSDSLSLQVPLLGLMKVSLVYKRMYTCKEWKENNVLELKWVKGSGDETCAYHPKAAIQVAFFACKALESSCYSPLSQLQSESEWREIFVDILQLAHCLEIDGLKKECEEHFTKLMSENPEGWLENLPFIFSFPGEFNAYRVVRKSFETLVEKGLKNINADFFPRLLNSLQKISEWDFSLFDKSKQLEFSYLFKKCFELLACENFLRKITNLDTVEQISEIFFDLFSDFDFSLKLLKVLHFWLKDIQFSQDQKNSKSFVLQLWLKSLFNPDLGVDFLNDMNLLLKDVKIAEVGHLIHGTWCRGKNRKDVNKKNLLQARKAFENVLKINSKNVFACIELGEINFLENKMDQAILMYSKAINFNPFKKSALIMRGKCYEAEGNVKAALEDYTTILTKSHLNFQALVARGTLNYKEKNFEKAISDFNNSITETKDRTYLSKIFFLRGKSFFELRQFSVAVNDFQFALEKNPENEAEIVNLLREATERS